MVFLSCGVGNTTPYRPYPVSSSASLWLSRGLMRNKLGFTCSHGGLGLGS